MNAAPNSSERNRLVNEIIASYLEAEAAGQAPDRAQILACHPDLAKELQTFFANHDALKQPSKLAEAITQSVDPRGSDAAEAVTAAPGQALQAGPGTHVRYFGDYELLEEIARGGMGVVYKARQLSLHRLVALKMILAGQLASPDDLQRFRREAEAAANLDHPNIVPIYEVGEHEGQHYFSMKLVEGGSLADKLRAEPNRSLTVAAQKEAAQLLATVARAVHHAHQSGILHRDLKPANILLDAAGVPYLTDFGLAKRITTESRLTQSNAVMGTPSYMPPEQAGGKKNVTTLADVYSLGAILYEQLTGQPPFRAETPLDTILLVLEQEPAPLRSLNPRVDADVETICLHCLAKEPSARYQSAAELADDLERWVADEPIRARPATTGERLAKWLKRQRGVAGLWALSLVLTLIAAASVLGVSAIVVGAALYALWIGLVLFLLARQARRREAMDKAAARPLSRAVARKEFARYNTMIFGLGIGAWLVPRLAEKWGASAEVANGITALFLFGVGLYLVFRWYILPSDVPDHTVEDPDLYGSAEKVPETASLSSNLERALVCIMISWILLVPTFDRSTKLILLGVVYFGATRPRSGQRGPSIKDVFGMAFIGSVLFGTVFAFLPPLPHVWEAAFGQNGQFYAMILSGVTFGALTLAIWRAYRVIIGSYVCVFVLFPSLGLMSLWENDWAVVHSWGWLYVALSFVPLAAAAIAAMLVHLGRLRRTPEWIGILAVLLALAGGMVSCTLLAAQLGERLAGDVGYECGLWGGVFSQLLAWLTIAQFFTDRSGKRSWVIAAPKQWMGLLVSAALASGGVLCLLLGKG